MLFNPVQVGKRTRYSYAKIKEVMEMPHLLDIQRDSYKWFLEEGLQEIFRDISPISDFAGNLTLSFESFSLGTPKYDLDECKERDVNYAAPLRVNVRLYNKETQDIKEQEVFMGDFPLMTDTGTFIINGAERVIVSQLVRSPGAYYGKTIDTTGKALFNSTVIPNRGAWIELETDVNDVIYVRIDRTRKLEATVLVRAMCKGFNNERILALFHNDPRIAATLDKDTTKDSDEAMVAIYKKLRPGEPPAIEAAKNHLNNLFFDPKRYDLATVGRYKFMKKLGWKRRLQGNVLKDALVDTETGEVLVPAGVEVTPDMLENITAEQEKAMFPYLDDEHTKPIELTVLVGDEGKEMHMLCTPTQDIYDRTITVADMLASISYMLNLMDGVGNVDDIDHLGNRRVRSVGELLQNQFRIGLSRMERMVRERMSSSDSEIITPQVLINIRPVVASIKEFFGSSQLSQFMDQHNPLSELTHKRRLSALGPGGLSRERAGFEVRDVHNSHYGRMCPIETPEGPNIGLIGSLSNYARVNKYGFMETPYRRIDKENNRVTDDVQYMTADEEDNLVIAQANEPLDENNWFVNERVIARQHEETLKIRREKVDYMDVSPKQVVSIATAMIPFLENDDANRALMGANMQRQAVPLLRTQAPLVGTGMEYKAACDSGVMVLAKRAGVVESVTANHIKIRTKTGELDSYKLQKFVRSNQGTCINQVPIVYKGDEVFEKQPIADGPATDHGELALGYNVIVAYMPWEGYNYEDAILLSENLVKRDLYTSIHIEEYECDSRDTKLGPEEITRDIPNVSEDALKDLDEDGIICIGAEVRPGDILVGKVTPKGETELTAEERLLRAIFGEKAREVRDTSLRVPHGEAGRIVDVKVFSRDKGDDTLGPGVNSLVRVYIAQKRKISVGDKMSGRHGNKGVVSRIMREEDMPFLPDGTPVDILLNPLGVPSRMNIGQVLETHLGMAVRNIGTQIKDAHKNMELGAELLTDAENLLNIAEDDEQREAAVNQKEKAEKMVADGKQALIDVRANLEKIGYDHEELPIPDVAGIHIATPVFDGAKPDKVFDTIAASGMAEDAKTILYDGRTGEPFENRVTVGCVYMLKLHHLVDDKIHARSTGPYSLVTQQPLGGKAQFGGQRFGEMEVWALEAYGAAYTLQEILTVKSDDVVGRVKTYESIVKGENIPEPGVPESFKVLIKELQSIGLDIEVLSEDGKAIAINDDDDIVADAQEVGDLNIADEMPETADEDMPEDESYDDVDDDGFGDTDDDDLIADLGTRGVMSDDNDDDFGDDDMDEDDLHRHMHDDLGDDLDDDLGDDTDFMSSFARRNDYDNNDDY